MERGFENVCELFTCTKKKNGEKERQRALYILTMPKLQEIFTTVATICHRYERLAVCKMMFSPLLCFEHEKTLKNFLEKLHTSKTKKKEEVEMKYCIWDLKNALTAIIVKSVGKVALFTSSFPSSPRPWPNVDQNVNVCAGNCSLISQH